MFEKLDMSLGEGFGMLWNRFENWVWQGRMFHLSEKLDHYNLGELRENMVKAANKYGEPLLLVCDSRGGTPNAAMQFATMLPEIGVPVVTLARSKVANEAVLILASGTLRGMRESALISLNGICVHTTKRRRLEDDLDYRLGERVRHKLEQTIDHALPDEMFRPMARPLSYTRSKAHRLVDKFYSEPPIGLMREARRRSREAKVEGWTME